MSFALREYEKAHAVIANMSEEATNEVANQGINSAKVKVISKAYLKLDFSKTVLDAIFSGRQAASNRLKSNE